MSFAGEVLQDRYRVESELGSGGMAKVYLARDLRLDRPVVVKVPHRHLLAAPEARARFLREIESLSRLAHPGIVAIQDSGEHDELPYAVVQYVSGGDLAARLAGDAAEASPEAVVRWLVPVAAALDYVHDQGFLHRDVKPANILFDEAGNPYLADFGIAALLAQESDDDGRLTRTGGFIGSARYAPPESVKRDLSPAYDQYSLALVVYHALSGRMPFHAETPEDLLIAKHTDEPTSLPRVARGVPLACAQAVMRAIEREPASRFGSCGEFARAFSEGLRDEAPAEPVEEPMRIAAPMLAVVVALALLTAGIVWLERRMTPAAPELPGPGMAAAPVSFRAGSTPAELEDALALCRAHGDECRADWYASEAVRDVTLVPVPIDLHEVTNAAFARFVAETGHVTQAERVGFSHAGPLPMRGLSWREPQGAGSTHRAAPDLPVVHVSANDAEAYCAARGQRLPTEDEWELAARGLERRRYPWGAAWDPSRLAWRRGPDAAARPVGSFPLGRTPEGHADLAGNVLEWTATVAASGDAAGAATGQTADRILKGGSWREANPAHLRAAAQFLESGDYTGGEVGFRCAGEANSGTFEGPGATHQAKRSDPQIE